MSTNSLAQKITPWVVAIAMFIETLDTTIINTAIPAMARFMQVNPIDLKIALISYLLSLALFIPISGWLADRYGQRNVFVSAILIFTISSIFCGLSNHLWQLVAARLFQGLGGALMMPIGRLILLRVFQRIELLNVMNLVVTVGLIGPSLGPLLGGVITQYFSWRWIFFVNVPFGIVGMIIAWNIIENKIDDNLHHLDKIGFILFGTSLAILVFTLSAISESQFHLPAIIFLFLLAIFGLITYFFHAKRSQYPILDINLLKIRTFFVSIMGSLFCRLGIGGIPFLLPLLFQVSFHYSPTLSGLLTLPNALGAMFAKRFTNRLLALISMKIYLIVNTILLGISIITLQFITVKTSYAFMGLIIFINGAFMAMQFSGMNPLAYCDVPQEKLSNATSITSTAQQLAMSFGVAFSAFLLILFGAHKHGSVHLPESLFHHAFWIQGLVTIISAGLFFILHKNDGETLYRIEKNLDQLEQ